MFCLWGASRRLEAVGAHARGFSGLGLPCKLPSASGVREKERSVFQPWREALPQEVPGWPLQGAFSRVIWTNSIFTFSFPTHMHAVAAPQCWLLALQRVWKAPRLKDKKTVVCRGEVVVPQCGDNCPTAECSLIPLGHSAHTVALKSFKCLGRQR